MSTDACTRRPRWRTILAISAGNAFEWFDFIIFGYFTLAIAKQFFPSSHPSSSLLLSLAVFGAAFVMRPLGAVVIGYYADRRGRKPALTLTILLMTLGTALIAFAPTRDSAGPVASYTILAARLLQGFSAGGEFGSATALLAEQDLASKGFLASWQFASQAIALVLATSAGMGLSITLDPEQLDTWGWRLPFVLGVLIGPIGIYIRSQIHESLEFQSAQINKSPAREVMTLFKSRIVTACGLVMVATVTVYTLVFMPTFAVHYLNYSFSDSFMVGLCAGAVQIVLIPASGALSDKWARLPLAAFAAVTIMTTSVPLLFQLTSAPTFVHLLIFQVWIGANLAIYLGVLPALMSELFPIHVRTTGLSVSYSLSVALFGGFAPLINSTLIDFTGSNAALSYYLIVAAAVSLVALVAARNFGAK